MNYSRSDSSISSLILNTGQKMHIPEIPPFRNKSIDSVEHTGSSASSSPQQTRFSPPITQITNKMPELTLKSFKAHRFPSERSTKVNVRNAISEFLSNFLFIFSKIYRIHFRTKKIKKKNYLNRKDNCLGYQIGYLDLK